MFNKTLNISTSPHLVKGLGTNDIMLNVVFAMLPAVIFSIYSFGIGALLVISVSIFGTVATEHYLCKISKKETTIGDWSAVVTGMLLGMTLPPNFPLWMAFIGGAIAIALGKFIFGGLGFNVFNPALVGRAFLQAAFPVAITTWYPTLETDRFTSIPSSSLALPFMEPTVDGMTGATPLAAFKFDGITTEITDLAFGMISGSAGETCAVLILLGGIYLILRNMMNWRIPVSIFLTVFIFSGAMYLVDSTIYPDPIFMLFSGGLMLGAVFMATDMVASPLNQKGVWIYGAVIGIVVVVIRLWGGLPEGVMYAILLANALSPHIEKLFHRRVYGT